MANTFVRLAVTALYFSSQVSVVRGKAIIAKDAASIQNAPAKEPWAYLGCYSDELVETKLTTRPDIIGGSKNLTVENCGLACRGLSFGFAAVGNGAECFCGDSFDNEEEATASSSKSCDVVCKGNVLEICGGLDHVDVYDLKHTVPGLVKQLNARVASSSITTSTSTKTSPVSTTSSVVSSAAPTTTAAPAPPGWAALGCYNDSVNARVLANELYTIPAANMTVELCVAACQKSKYKLAGLEYSQECYCDNKIENFGAIADSGCTMTCNGNSSEFCGGSNRLNIYNYTATAVSATSTGTGGSAPTGIPTDLPTGWKYKGCWIDEAYGRILANAEPDNANLSVETCISTCAASGYSIAGMEYYTQCFCGNAMLNQAALASDDSDCNTSCGGNDNEICGGGDRMSIYSNETTLDITPIPKIQKTGLPGSWNYTGCLSDIDGNRVFPYEIQLPQNNTAEDCLNLCAEFGYGAGGMEYSVQCFCGDADNILTNTGNATIVDDSECNMVCSGNDSYICGGPDRISYYSWTGQPLNSWTFETGNNAGQYEFLIGGVIIPLVSTPTINGKIAFLEKFGTEPANNSTGAYELDLASLDNFTAAWRPMHVKTDVFCSAGLTLPDKAGRIINVGGWANPATTGIRLYWPDGSPGVWGTNDWQENYEEVSLQVGRWYPSAMTMVNGSILVVGGEEGSNGAPVPSLEIIPRPAGGPVQFCDYLNRTDPFNLYPYLLVLPSGGVFIAYYNEARILDELTLQTVRTLPNMPGAVNNFLGGRTYPMEGTAMVLPQHAPYTDPLIVIICGGSTPFAEVALDNCVSITPEVPGANWTIERMPSKRVISSICALPDGTFLILNGAHAGFAGFGLASDPNLNAVLYDPSLPVNSRMKVMANTTIARMYHSEAVLVPDGRVLVTGSDPEDPRYPQEYRVEVFYPPYLLSGLTKPNFTLNTGNDFPYASTFSITVHLPHGTTSTMRISLMAAVSSTHGNSFGARTLFPSFTCVGNTCTVQTPPNGHVSPPAWHQLFVLDGPTPSNGQWVRIGGDPGKLGNWPDFPDFHPLPGI